MPQIVKFQSSRKFPDGTLVVIYQHADGSRCVRTEKEHAKLGNPIVSICDEDVVIEKPIPTSKPLPPLREQAANFLEALKEHAADDFVKVDQETLNARIAICESCPSLKNGRCVECGCGCNNKKEFFNKLSWRSSHCPLDEPKW